MAITYSEKLRDPRWQKKRLKILERDEWMCQSCYDSQSTLHIHHRYYSSGDPWDCSDESLVTMCESCHLLETQDRPGSEARLIAALRSCGAWSNDLDKLAEAFEALYVGGGHDYLAAALHFAITDPNAQKSLCDRYAEFLASKRDQYEHSCEELSVPA